MLIILDGIDGAGKTTQTELLIKRLKKHGCKTKTLDFPQYKQNFFGGMVKQFLNGDFGGIDKVDPHLASLLYALDRWENSRAISRWIKSGAVVVMNRYSTANMIHQSVKLPLKQRAQFIRWIEKLEYEIFGIPKPDLVIYLSLPYTLAYALIKKRGNAKDIHEKDQKHLANAANMGMRLARARNWKIVECNEGKNKIRSKEIIAGDIWKIVRKKINLPLPTPS